MPRPTSLTGWWFDLLETRARGNVALLAGLLDVSTRTLNKWGNGVQASGNNLRRLQKLAGPELLAQEDCPKYIKPKKRKEA